MPGNGKRISFSAKCFGRCFLTVTSDITSPSLQDSYRCRTPKTSEHQFRSVSQDRVMQPDLIQFIQIEMLGG